MDPSERASSSSSLEHVRQALTRAIAELSLRDVHVSLDQACADARRIRSAEAEDARRWSSLHDASRRLANVLRVGSGGMVVLAVLSCALTVHGPARSHHTVIVQLAQVLLTMIAAVGFGILTVIANELLRHVGRLGELAEQVRAAVAEREKAHEAAEGEAK